MLARAIHQESPRADGAFVAVSCAALPEALIESELFGHERGAFTGAIKDRPGRFEMAEAGTIFLDDIDDVPLGMQVKLLRVLPNRTIERLGGTRVIPVNVRVLAGTKRDLKQLVAEGKFREDLYYRLNVIHLTVPPLRDRAEDIPLLLEHFTSMFAAEYSAPRIRFLPEAWNLLLDYPWPGNVRELRNLIERLTVRNTQAQQPVGAADLPQEIRRTPAGAAAPAARATVAESLFQQIVEGRQSFWSAVYGPFMSRDLTRDDLRALIGIGLQQTSGSYRVLVELFNMPSGDYKRFLNFLRKHQCHMPFQQFRAGLPRVEAAAGTPGAERQRVPASV
jgi:transcriptional regulator with PAS, ATPase and Fis domain